MLDILWKAMSFLILMIILVGFHEFGHFYAARKLGIKVLCFSIGFGRVLFRHHGKDGCEYVFSAIPLGGFVKMLDEGESPVLDHEKHLAFNRQPIWKRFLVVLAGPFANALLAFVLLFGLYLYGVPAFRAEIAAPLPDTPFAQAQLQKGDTILKVDDKNISSFQQLNVALVDTLGDGSAKLSIKRGDQYFESNIELGHPLQIDNQIDLTSTLGLAENLPDFKVIIQEITPNMPALLADLKPKDEIIQINGQTVNNIRLVSKILQKNQDQPLRFQIKRDDQRHDITVKPIKNDQGNYVIGVLLNQALKDPAEFEAALSHMRITQRYSMVASLQRAYTETLDNGVLVFKFIGRMFTGDVKINAMGGPLTIADIAGSALKSGVVSFISLVALLSVNIGAMNLLPVPVLDGGRLVGYLFEAFANVFKIRIPKRLGILTLQTGAAVLFLFMGIVIFYDVLKYIF